MNKIQRILLRLEVWIGGLSDLFVYWLYSINSFNIQSLHSFFRQVWFYSWKTKIKKLGILKYLPKPESDRVKTNFCASTVKTFVICFLFCFSQNNRDWLIRYRHVSFFVMVKFILVFQQSDKGYHYYYLGLGCMYVSLFPLHKCFYAKMGMQMFVNSFKNISM